MVRAWMVMGLCGVLGLGCDSSDDDDDSKLAGDPLDCAWMASNNCWKTTVAAAASCVPPASETGVLSADGTSCAYASGSSVAFHHPVILPMDFEDDTEWSFTQSQGGQPCVTFDDVDGSSQVLTVQGMTFEEHTIGVGLQVTCPDGSQYAAENAFDLFECDGLFTDGPGYATSSSDVSVSFSFLNGADGLQVFDCAR